MTTRRHSVRFAALGLAVSGLLTIAACGGDDSDDTPTTTDAAVTTVAADDSAAPDDSADAADPADTDASTDETAADMGEEAGDEGATDATFDTSDVDALSAEECQALYQDFAGLGLDPSGQSPEDVDDAFDALSNALPGDLQGDLELMRDAFAAFQDVAANAQNDPTNPEYLEALEALDTPEFAEASARLDAYFSNCEGELD